MRKIRLKFKKILSYLDKKKALKDDLSKKKKEFKK